jgi:triphosphoribosyl-dephospho-CoA synthase
MNHILHYAHDDKKLAREMARMAVRALYFEVKSYPKPGLVSFVDSGAHTDMNGETFYRSLFSLRHYFYRLVIQGLLDTQFNCLKTISLHAEEKMLNATQGINTHRGALFALGLFCISSARLLKKGMSFSTEELHMQMKSDWQVSLENHQGNEKSNGNHVLKALADKKIIGAKEMAILGYPLVFKKLSDFIEFFDEHKCMNRSGLYIYLYLLTNIDDTNILHRKGWETLQLAKEKAHNILKVSCVKEREKQAIQLHHYFSKQGISPGGVGDLMGVFIFLGQLFSETMRCHY